MMGNKTPVILADAEGIARAAQVLRDGGLVAVPTETVYGLAARADSAEAVAKIYEAKGRPSFNPLIVHVRDLEQAQQYGVLKGSVLGPAGSQWPGPLTLVVPRQANSGLADPITAGLDTVALRVPEHRVMQALLTAVDLPLAAPSANRSGYISPTTVEHVLASLDGRIDLVIDGGPTAGGVESTILAVREDDRWDELRPGPIDIDALYEVYFEKPRELQSASVGIEAPGQMKSHYAPGKPLRLNARTAESDEFFIGFGKTAGDCTLSETGDLQLAASRLYDCLHKAAGSSYPRIAVAPIPAEGIGRAINDRLRRAAA